MMLLRLAPEYFNTKPRPFALALSLLISSGCVGEYQEINELHSKSSSVTCELPPPSKILINEANKLLQYWEIPDDKSFWEQRRYEDPVLKKFLSNVKLRTNVNPAYLLSFGSYNSSLIATGKAGALRKANCLETKLLAIQANRIQPMIDKPTEYLALILRRKVNAKHLLKIYYYTVDQPGIGRVSDLLEPLSSSRSDGWTFYANLHNHNFFITDGEPGGRTAPSKPDAHLNKGWGEEFQMQSAWITNGFNTVEIKASEFALFEIMGPQ